MKVAVCIITHENEQWFFEQIASQNHQIEKIKFFQEKDLQPKNTFWRRLASKLANFFFSFKKHQVSDEDILSFYLKRLQVTFAHTINSTMSGTDRLVEILSLNRIIKNKKQNIKNCFRLSFKVMKEFDALFIYNGCLPEHKCLIEAAKILGKKIVFFEVGPFQNTILMDHAGINYSSSIPRQISFYQNWAQKNPELIFNPENSDKAPKLGGRESAHHQFLQKNTLDLSKKYIFLPMQFAIDTQILFHGTWIKHIDHLVEIAHQAVQYLPEGWRVITKEHPEAFWRYKTHTMETDRFLFANGNPTPDLIKNASLIVTLNSSVGLEAMLFDKPVVTLGQAFYAFDGLTQQCNSAEDLFEIFKNPEQISFNPKDRRAFLAWLANDYYLDGSFYTKTFFMNDKNKRLISQILQAKSNG